MSNAHFFLFKRFCDVASLRFNFTVNDATAETIDISVSFVYASEEYNEYLSVVSLFCQNICLNLTEKYNFDVEFLLNL